MMKNPAAIRLELLHRRLARYSVPHLFDVFNSTRYRHILRTVRQYRITLLLHSWLTVAGLLLDVWTLYHFALMALAFAGMAVAVLLARRPSGRLGVIGFGMVFTLGMYNIIMVVIPGVAWWLKLYGLIIGAWQLRIVYPMYRSGQWRTWLQVKRPAASVARLHTEIWDAMTKATMDDHRNIIEVQADRVTWRIWILGTHCVLARSTRDNPLELLLLSQNDIIFHDTFMANGVHFGRMDVEGNGVSVSMTRQAWDRFRGWKSRMLLRGAKGDAKFSTFSNN